MCVQRNSACALRWRIARPTISMKRKTFDLPAPFGPIITVGLGRSSTLKSARERKPLTWIDSIMAAAPSRRSGCHWVGRGREAVHYYGGDVQFVGMHGQQVVGAGLPQRVAWHRRQAAQELAGWGEDHGGGP